MDSAGPITGRSLARTLGVSPTTASSTLNRLLKVDFAIREQSGRAFSWQANLHDPTIASWLEERRRPGVIPLRDPKRQWRVVVILTALELEYDAIAEHVEFDRFSRVAGFRFQQGHFSGDSIDWTVHTARIGMGNTRAGIVLTKAAATFSPDLVLFVGIAGSVKPKDLCRGDVIVPERVYQLGAGKDVQEPEGSTFLARPLSFLATTELVQLATAVAAR